MTKEKTGKLGDRKKNVIWNVAQRNKRMKKQRIWVRIIKDTINSLILVSQVCQEEIEERK